MGIDFLFKITYFSKYLQKIISEKSYSWNYIVLIENSVKFIKDS
jgi:hypothetical protein